MGKRVVLLFSLGLGVVALVSATTFGQTTGPQMYDIPIAAGTDDAEEHLNAGMDVTSSDLEIPYEDAGTPATDEQLIGMRWIVPITKDFMVGKAYIEFEIKEIKGSNTNTAPVNLIIEGQLDPNPPAFASAAKNITNRTRTKAQVKWSLPTGMAVSARFQTPDISAIIKEVISQDGWASGNALVLILRDDKSAPSTGLRCVHAYDGSTIGAPLLHIQPPWPWATKPNPADGATGVSQALFSWTAGEGAVVHNVYIGTSPELTEANLVAKNQPFAMYFHAAGFEPGVKYYWRVDEVDTTGQVSTGTVWSFSTPSLKAYVPAPRNGGKYVPTDTTLTWTAGSGGHLHYVYFGTSFDEVDKASGGTFQTDTTYVPAGPLAQDKTYYWRVDESDGVNVHKGDVWSFTTMPDIQITNPDLIGWWKFDEGVGSKAIDFSGHGNDGKLGGGVKWVDGIAGGAVQLTNGYAVIDGIVDDLKGTNLTLSAWIKTTQANEGELFAANDSGSGYALMFGVLGGKAYRWDGNEEEYGPSVNDNQWHLLTYVRDGGTGSIYVDGALCGSYSTSFSLSNIPRWSIGQEWDDANPSNFYVGLVDDARVYKKALTPDEVKELLRGDPALAWKPSPDNRSTVDVVKAEDGLTWSAGDNTKQHDVYFGLDQAAVKNADASDKTGAYRGRQAETSYVPTETPGWGTGPYYWRVDEVQEDGTISTGTVWSFSVASYLIVDDMEAYTDKEGEQIYTTWVDGFTDQSNGSTVGLMTAAGGTFGETTIVHGGRQSMPMAYDNSKSPFYSEAVQTFTPLQDWTAYGIDALVLFWHGHAANGADKLYVTVEDSAGKQATATNADSAAAKAATWTEWKIPLSSLNGVNLAKIKKLYLGVGDRKAPATGGTGTVYIDDIRLTKP